MSREKSLVTVDWAEKNLSTPGFVFVEVDEDTTAYDTGHLAGAVKLNWKTDLQDPLRRDFVDKAGFESCCPPKASPMTTQSSFTAGTTTGSPRTPTGISSSTAMRTSSWSTAAGRNGSSTVGR